MSAGRPSTIAGKLAYRAYLLILRREAMIWLRVRRWLVDRMLGRRHVGLNIFPDVFIEDIAGLTLGDHVSINRGCNLSAGGGLTIGNHVAIGHGTSIITSNHGFELSDVPIKAQPIVWDRVAIGDNVWIGARVCILAGVSIADGAVVAAGAVVNRPVAERDAIVGGVPARRLGSRR